MSIEQMRAHILAEYPSQRWHDKVKVMSDSQVMAVYMRIINKNTSKKG